ncbi:MAG: hypothetical protein LBU47_06655 [Christensenellaceae bacterium]|jgi:hypothetical protein|nr:hypothetical protein [Christensenellaceae bacterium]
MKLIDFDGRFQEHLRLWMRANQKKYKNVDEMEALMPELYTRWLNEPADWLEGEKPGFYFDRLEDPAQLIAWMRAYMQGSVPVPGQLLDRISALGEAAAEFLTALAGEEGASHEERMTAIGLLREIESERPKALYLSMLKQAERPDELIESALESLKAMRGVLEPCLGLIAGASPAMREALADLLCEYPGDERVLAFLAEEFASSKKKALYASFLGKLGDERALPALERAAGDPALNYLDFIEISGAILTLGGDAPPEREFSGDPYYESLKNSE